MISAPLAEALAATWPPAETRHVGGFAVGRGEGGGGRVSAARAVGGWNAADIPAAEAQMAAWRQPPLFSVAGTDAALGAALAARGYAASGPVAVLQAPVAPLTQVPIPPVTALECWPPLAIQRDLWAACGIGPARQAVMQRVPAPRTAILGRVSDRAAGAGFAAVHGGIGVLHALAVLPEWRRKGVAGWMVRRAARFAAANGADRLALAVAEDNAPALALYDRLGFRRVGGYAYWRPLTPASPAA